MSAPLLQVRDLRVEFHSRAGVNYAVNGVSFDLNSGETLGIVGESGSGKSVTCATLMGLLPSPPARIGAESRAWFDGTDLLHAPEKVHAGLRGRRISMIFQDPMTCLNPCMCIGDQVAEPLVLHQGLSWREARRLAVQELARTGIPDPEKRAIANAITLVFTDGTRFEEVVVEYPIGHARRRQDGIPKLVDKFKINLARQFPTRQQQRILEVSLDRTRLEQMPVNEYLDLYVI